MEGLGASEKGWEVGPKFSVAQTLAIVSGCCLLEVDEPKGLNIFDFLSELIVESSSSNAEDKSCLRS